MENVPPHTVSPSPVGAGPVQHWQQRALEHWELINRLAGRRFPGSALAEEAALFVLNRLAADDWRRLRAFTGESTLATYIAALSFRLLEDFARARFGRSTPPLWVRRLGGIWLTLFRLLCLERFTPDEAVALVHQQQAGDPRQIERAAYQLLGEIPSCGEHRGDAPGGGAETDLRVGDEADCPEQEQRLTEGEREQLFATLGRVVFDEAVADSGSRLLARVSAANIELAPRERLLLKLCFRDGVAVTEAGRMLGWNRFQVHGRLRRLLERLRRELARVGLEEELRLLL